VPAPRRRSGNVPGEAGAQRCLGHVQRNHDQAARYYLAAKQISNGNGDRLGAAHAPRWLPANVPGLVVAQVIDAVVTVARQRRRVALDLDVIYDLGGRVIRTRRE
jgi:hypothetical protein